MIAEENFARERVLQLRAGRRPQIRNLSLALLTGALMAFAFPNWDVWVLAWLALAPLLVAVERERGALRAFGLGLVSGTLFFYMTCWFIAYSPVHYADFSRPVAYGLAVLPCLLFGCFFGLFALAVHVLTRRFGPHALLAAPFAWVATEWLRITTFGVGWDMLGYSQAFEPILVQTAAIGGVYAVSFLLCASSTGLAYALVAPSRRAALRGMAAGLALIVGNVAYGAFALSRVAPPSESGLPVVAVQPNFPIGTLAAPGPSNAEAVEKLDAMGAAESANAQPLAAPALIVWPEIPVSLYYQDAPWVAESFRETTTRRGDYLLANGIGTVTGRDESRGQIYDHTNAAVLVGPDGGVAGHYEKIHLLPFGEYVPMRAMIPFLNAVPALASEFTPGTEVRLLDVENARYGASICFESSFPALARDARRAGASGFVNLTNDAWFGPTPEPRQHLAHAVMRSVENATEQVRVTNAGYSAHIDAGGRITDSTELFAEATRRWTLPREPGPMTFYTWAGDWLPILALLGVVGLVGYGLARPKPAVIELERN